MQPEEPNKYVKDLTQEKYKYGFTTDVHTEVIERGLNEDVVRLISAKKNEPEWLLEDRKSTRLNSSHPPESRMPSSA